MLGSLCLGVALPLIVTARNPGIGLGLPGLWLYLLGLALIAWGSMEILARRGSAGGAFALAAPLLFGLWLLYVWEVAVVGFGVPQILLPAPHQIGHQLFSQADLLWVDFHQTFLKAVLAGWAAGCGLGFLTAVLIDRVPFLQRGLLPLGNLVSAVPVVGVAPIMVMWFGFDWPSKAAVIVVMTFFPMLINTIAGFSQVDAMGRDMMQAYGATYWQSFFKLRLPSALPFIFNALKINSTLAMIGAIVAEFFGSPIAAFDTSSHASHVSSRSAYAARALGRIEVPSPNRSGGFSASTSLRMASAVASGSPRSTFARCVRNCFRNSVYGSSASAICEDFPKSVA